jgi:hypothetical protein
VSYYSTDQLCSPEGNVFHSVDGSTPSFHLSPGASHSSLRSLDSRPHSLFSFPSQNGITSVSDDVFIKGAEKNLYDCSSLPISLMKKKKQRSRTGSPFASPSASHQGLRPSPLTSTPVTTGPSIETRKPEDHRQGSGSLLALPKMPNLRPSGPSGALSSLRMSHLRNSLQRRVNTDFRSSSRRSHRVMSDHVLTEDTVSSELPQLLSLKRLCHDFRTTCFCSRNLNSGESRWKRCQLRSQTAGAMVDLACHCQSV